MTRPRILPAILVAGAACATARAARVPEWVRAVVDAAPAEPEGPPSPDARVLFDETRIEIAPDGSRRLRLRSVLRARSSRDPDVGTGAIGHGGERKVVKSLAWHLPPGERAQKTREVVEVTLGEDFFTDDATRFIGFDDVDRGSVVAFEFEVQEAPWTQTERLAIATGAGPVDLARIEVVHPSGWALRHAWIGDRGVAARAIPNGAVFELRDIPPAAPPSEAPLAPEPDPMPLQLVLGFDPPSEGPRVSAAAIRSWDDVARWYSRTAAGRDRAGTQVQARLAQAKGDATGFPEVVAAVGSFVRDRVRYLAREVGIGGYRPHAAEETATVLYGDCKDKATLLSAMLEPAGIRAHPVLVHSGGRAYVAREVPDPGGFDHMITAIEVPADSTIPPEWEGATLSGGPTGRLLIFDPTDSYGAVGALPSDLSGATALLVLGETGTLLELPVQPARMHRVERRVTLTGNADGGFAGEDRRTAYGEYASLARSAYRGDPADLRRARESVLRERWPRVQAEVHSVREIAASGGFEDTIRFSIPDLSAGAEFSPFRPVSDEIPKASLRRRTEPVDFGFPRIVVVESDVPGWPEATPLPAALAERGDGWSVTGGFERREGGLRGRLEVTLERRRFSPEQFPELRRFYEALAAAQSTPVPAPR